MQEEKLTDKDVAPRVAGASDIEGAYSGYIRHKRLVMVALVRACHRHLCDDGRFVVAHGTGKDGINSHHQAVAADVSLGLKPACEEANAWRELFEIDAIVDTPGFYAFAGEKLPFRGRGLRLWAAERSSACE